MAHIDRITEDKIKDAANIVSVIGDWVTLRKSGVEYVGLCPFHDDHTPTNFKVNPNKQMYKCFACGEGGDVFTFLKKKANLDYGDALRYLAQKFSVYIPDEDPKERDRWQHIKPAKPRDISDVEPDRQMLIMPREWVSKTMKATMPCVFIDWFRSLPWASDPANNQRARVDETLWQYCVGRWTNGRVVFWYIDEQGRVHGGKIMTYQQNGRRYHNKKDEPNSTTWVHYQRGKNGQPLCNMKTYKYEHLLFGSHLLNRYPQAVVNIVESEKTALICANAYGHLEQNLWLACGGLQFFKLEHIQPLLDAKRRIWLWPDKDGVSQWESKMKDILSDRVTMTTRFIEDNWTPEDGEKADVADIILRHIQQPSTAVDRRNNHTGDGQDASEELKVNSEEVTTNNSQSSARPNGTLAPARIVNSQLKEKPEGITDEEWAEHLKIMADIKGWQIAHPDEINTPFLDPIELQDPRVREWREKLRQAYPMKWDTIPVSKVQGVKAVGELVRDHPLVKKLLKTIGDKDNEQR